MVTYIQDVNHTPRINTLSLRVCREPDKRRDSPREQTHTEGLILNEAHNIKNRVEVTKKTTATNSTSESTSAEGR